jgi:hypothetical protein
MKKLIGEFLQRFVSNAPRTEEVLFRDVCKYCVTTSRFAGPHSDRNQTLRFLYLQVW